MEQDRQILFELVEFKACGRRLAVETKFVDEAITLKISVCVPQHLPLVKGITNVSGQIVTVIDLSVLFGTQELPDDAPRHAKQSNSASDGLIPQIWRFAFSCLC
jgi:chemotaxis signal transduction protein